MDKLKLLFAVDARQITDTSDYLLKKTFKWIREAANRNQSQLILDGHEFDTEAVNQVIFELKNYGYTVKPYEDIYQTYTITW